jgi:type IV secretory pathway TrbL component
MRQTSTTAASAATLYDTDAGTWPDAALAMKRPAATSASSAVSASHAGCEPVRRPGAGLAPAGADVGWPQRKQTIALSEISVPQC